MSDVLTMYLDEILKYKDFIKSVGPRQSKMFLLPSAMF